LQTPVGATVTGGGMPFGHWVTFLEHQLPGAPPHCWSFVQAPPDAAVPVVAPVTVAEVAVVPVPVALDDAPPEPIVTLCPHPKMSAANGSRHQDDLCIDPPPNCVKKALTRS
jgi:hypothetical protein